LGSFQSSLSFFSYLVGFPNIIPKIPLNIKSGQYKMIAIRFFKFMYDFYVGLIGFLAVSIYDNAF
jgi:hypothetical protein